MTWRSVPWTGNSMMNNFAGHIMVIVQYLGAHLLVNCMFNAHLPHHLLVLLQLLAPAALKTWGPELANSCIMYHCVNLAVVNIINDTSSKDPTLMVLVRQFVLLAMKYNILFRALHIPGSSNIISDLLSRFHICHPFKLSYNWALSHRQCYSTYIR